MSYAALIDQSINKVYQKGIATKILQHMNRLRNVSDLSQARRWIMELFQNSRDVAYPDQPVKIRVELTDDTVSFSHNGRPFRVKDILSIINQVSSKDPDDQTIGQFGTGFMTTYQLSEEVEIHSVLKDGDLPYKPFRICINRRGDSQEHILEEIFRTMEELKKADEGPDTEFHPDDFNTNFIYRLDHKESFLSAKTGMDDLKDTILYVLLFSEKIAQVELIYRTSQETRTVLYKRGKDEAFGSHLRILQILENDTLRSVVYMKNENLTLAAEWSKEKGFLPFSPQTPKLFVDFPLIGSEEFPFPIVINNNQFCPNEPRSGISLVDNTSSRDALKNKELMEHAVNVYRTYLQEAVSLGCEGMEHIISLPAWKPNKELSESWVKDRLYRGLYRIVSAEPFIATEQGMFPLNHPHLYLVSGESDEETIAVKQLCSALKNHIMPSDQVPWARHFEAYTDYGFSPDKVKTLAKIAFRASHCLRYELDVNQMEPMQWLNQLYAHCLNNDFLKMKIRAGNLDIFPSQNPDTWKQGTLYSINQIKKDPGIPEIFKQVSDVLDGLVLQPEEEKLRIRDTLLHQDFEHQNLSELPFYERSRLESHIVRRSDGHLNISPYYRSHCEAIRNRAWYLMLSCGPDKELYDLCRQGYDATIPDREELSVEIGADVWRNTYRAISGKLLHWLSSLGRMELLIKKKFADQDEDTAYQWMNQVILRTTHYLDSYSVGKKVIFPNQNGQFFSNSSLKRDQIQEEEFKQIAPAFHDESDCNMKSYLLDRRVPAESIFFTEFTDEDAARIINQAVQRLLSRQNLAESDAERQEACTRLLGWIQEHTELAEKYFPGFCKEEDQMKLLTPKVAVHMQRKAKALRQVMEKLGVSSEDELFERLQTLSSETKTPEPTRTLADHWDTGSDVFWDDEDGLGFGEDRDRFLQEIGIGGEAYALRVLKEAAQSQGFETTLESCDTVQMERVLETGKETLELYHPDSELYHQSGWDIRQTRTSSAGNKIVDYFEVKTHTPHSRYKHVLLLSDEQMKMAIRQREHYTILMVVYDPLSKSGIFATSYVNAAEHIASGKFVNAEKRHMYLVTG